MVCNNCKETKEYDMLKLECDGCGKSVQGATKVVICTRGFIELEGTKVVVPETTTEDELGTLYLCGECYELLSSVFEDLDQVRRIISNKRKALEKAGGSEEN